MPIRDYFVHILDYFFIFDLIHCATMLSRNLRIPLAVGRQNVFSKVYRYSTITEPPIMKELREDLKTAMRNKETHRKDALRAVMAAVKNANIEKAGSVVSDLSLHDLISSTISKRKKTIEAYAEAKRQDLVDKEQAGIAALEEFISRIAVASEDEVSVKILEIASKLGVDVKDVSAKKVLMSKIPWQEIEKDWRATRKMVTRSVMRLTSKREYSTLRTLHDNTGIRPFSTYSAPSQHENPLVGISSM